MVHCTKGLGEQHLCKVMYNYRRIGVQLELDDWCACVLVCVLTSILDEYTRDTYSYSSYSAITFCCGL